MFGIRRLPRSIRTLDGSQLVGPCGLTRRSARRSLHKLPRPFQRRAGIEHGDLRATPVGKAKNSVCGWILTLSPKLVLPAQVIESMTAGQPVVRVLIVLPVPLDVS